MTTETLKGLRVLLVANDPPGHAVYRYRAAHLAEALQSYGAHADVHFAGDARVRVAHDLVILHRICWNQTGRAFARAARACGAVLVYSTDDYIWDADVLRSDAHLPPAMAETLVRFAPLHRRMAEEADALLVSTGYLHQRFQEEAPKTPCAVIPNFLSRQQVELSDAAWRQHRSSSETTQKTVVTLGYLSGSRYHDADFALIGDALAEVLTTFPQTRLLLAGPVMLPPALASFADTERIVRQTLVPWTRLPELLAQVDINLAPLDAMRPLNQGRSAIKWWEAALVRVPILASATAGFTEALTGAPEMLRALLLPGADAWYPALAQQVQTALHEPQGLEPLGEVAYAWAHENGTTPTGSAWFPRQITLLTHAPHATPPRPRASRVNWPFSVRYAAKDALRFLRSRGRIQ